MTRRLLGAAVLAFASFAVHAQGSCTSASDACFFAFTAPGSPGQMHFYASQPPGVPASGAPPVAALIALHGHSHDANKTFEAALLASQRAGTLDRTLVVAPLFQVGGRAAARCETAGVPAAQPGDLLWTCGSWPEGAGADGGRGPSSFAAMDALFAELVRRWPSLRTLTLAGFSAGGQMVQHYIGFAAEPPAGVDIRYVVADPGSWLYFDSTRAMPIDAASCPTVNQWKYGTDALPPSLGNAVQARARYAAADIRYLEGELDSGDARGTAYKVLDRSCAASAQGPFRLQRGLTYAEYDRTLLAPTQHRHVTVVPGCAHDVACVFPSAAARAALFGPP